MADPTFAYMATETANTKRPAAMNATSAAIRSGPVASLTGIKVWRPSPISQMIIEGQLAYDHVLYETYTESADVQAGDLIIFPNTSTQEYPIIEVEPLPWPPNTGTGVRTRIVYKAAR